VRRREKKIRPSDDSGPGVEKVCRFVMEDWVTEDERENAPKTEIGWEDLSLVAERRWLDACARWAELHGLKRGEAYARLEAERRRLFPPIHNVFVTSPERSGHGLEVQS